MPMNDTSERHRGGGGGGEYVVSLFCGVGAAGHVGHGGLGTWKRASRGEAFRGGVSWSSPGEGG